MDSDLLKESSLSFNALLNYRYEVVLGKKGKQEEIRIVFEKSDFHHFAGLHKLTDLQKVHKRKAQTIFEECLSGVISFEDICKSDYINKCEIRLEIIKKFEDIMSQPNTYVRFNKVDPQSKMKWKYHLEFMVEGEEGYIFLDEYRSCPGTYMCVSCFNKGTFNYANNQVRMTLLQTKKVDIDTGEVVILYTNPSYTQVVNI